MDKNNSNNENHSAMRGILWLLPLLGMLGVLLYPSQKDTKLKREVIEVIEVDSTVIAPKNVNKSTILFRFDPNSVTYKELRSLGLSKQQAASVIKWRESGKIFRISEDLATCYYMTDSLYFTLEPYIRINEKYKIVKYERDQILDTTLLRNQTKESGRGAKDSLFKFDPNTITDKEFKLLGFSDSQTATFLKYRIMVGRFDNVEEFLKCYSVADRAEQLKPYIHIAPKPKVELNSADSIQLCSIDGIGIISVRAIIDYRKKLGGFANIEQLTEIPQIREHNYEKILKQIYLDSLVITKIDVNFAPAEHLVESLLEHPYAGRLVVRRLLKEKQLKGGWRTIGELVELDILTTNQAKKLAPYLHFRVPNEN